MVNVSEYDTSIYKIVSEHKVVKKEATGVFDYNIFQTVRDTIYNLAILLQ